MLVGNFIFAVEENLPRFIIYVLLIIIFRILFSLSIGFDCKAQKISHHFLWMTGCFFFPLFAGIIYVCSRGRATEGFKKICCRCNAAVDQKAVYCGYCGNASFHEKDLEDSNKYKKLSKIFFGLAIVMMVAAYIIYFTLVSDIFMDFLNTLSDASDIG